MTPLMRGLAGIAVASVTLTVIVGSATPQQPTTAEINRKTSGLIRALAQPGSLGPNDFPTARTDRERELSDVGSTTRRGANLPKLELFVQYASNSSNPGGRIVPATPDVVPGLVANDATQAVELQRPPAFDPEDVRPFNRDARRTHHVGEFNARYPGFEGAGRVAVVIDEGAVRATHQEFRGAGAGAKPRVVVRGQPQPPLSQHSTHVAGTLIAAGVDSRAKGMAPAAGVISMDFGSDLQKFAALTGVVHITNHSYGPATGWHSHPRYGWMWWGDRALSEDEDAGFGRYTARASTLDGLLVAPERAQWLTFVAAGNNRNDEPQRQPVSHFALGVVNSRPEWQKSERIRNADGADSGGVDTVSGLCLAKNVICIGAIHDGQTGVPFSTTDFSGWGPADDGRVKPDLAANGDNLLSTSEANDDAYLELPGTSMASPTAGGIALIVGEAFTKFRGRHPLGTELKAVLIHSAVDAGRPGPDVEFGWGVIDALAAGDIVASRDRHSIETFAVSASQPTTSNWESNGSPIRVTIVWHDPPGMANTGPLDDSTPALENDLDVELVDPNGNVHHPYRLDLTAPVADARRDGPNRVDNVEVIDAPAISGLWRVRIAAHALSVGSQQALTLVTSGLTRRP